MCLISLSDRMVVLSNHHDAWTFGAVDPNSGTAVMMEIARGFSELRKLGDFILVDYVEHNEGNLHTSNYSVSKICCDICSWCLTKVGDPAAPSSSAAGMVRSRVSWDQQSGWRWGVPMIPAMYIIMMTVLLWIRSDYCKATWQIKSRLYIFKLQYVLILHQMLSSSHWSANWIWSWCKELWVSTSW